MVEQDKGTMVWVDSDLYDKIDSTAKKAKKSKVQVMREAFDL